MTHNRRYPTQDKHYSRKRARLDSECCSPDHSRLSQANRIVELEYISHMHYQVSKVLKHAFWQDFVDVWIYY